LLFIYFNINSTIQTMAVADLSLCFTEKKKIMQVWSIVWVSTWRQNFIFRSTISGNKWAFSFFTLWEENL